MNYSGSRGVSGLAVAIAAALAVSGSVGAGELQRLPSLRISDAVHELAQPSSRSGVAVSRPAERQPRVAGTAAVPKSDDPFVLFHEDFQSYSSMQSYPVPAPPMIVVNQDGLVPHPMVGYVTDAWVVRSDGIAAGNLAAASTSYYVPAGIADDWLILPAVPVTGNTRISWRGRSLDQVYLESYRVWVSPSGGSALADFTSVVADTGPVGEGPAWNARSVWLSPFAGQTVRVAFQNYSTDKFLVLVDDILIENVPDFDAAITETVLLPPYTQVPAFLEYAAPVTLYVTNNGEQAISGAQLSVDILADGEAVDTQVLPAIASVASEATQAVAMSVPVLAEAQYALAASVAIDETDQRPGNDSRLFDDVVIGTAATLARDDGEATTYVLIGNGRSGELGRSSRSTGRSRYSVRRSRLGYTRPHRTFPICVAKRCAFACADGTRRPPSPT